MGRKEGLSSLSDLSKVWHMAQSFQQGQSSVNTCYMNEHSSCQKIRTWIESFWTQVQCFSVLLHPSCTELQQEVCSSAHRFTESSVRLYFVPGPVRSTQSSSEGGSCPHRAHTQEVGLRAERRPWEERGKQDNFGLWQIFWRKQTG